LAIFGLIKQIPKDWVKPPEPEYQKNLYNEGFYSTQLWQADKLQEHPAIERDLKELDEYLLPLFWDYNQKAAYYQNQYFMYQRVFIFGAFLTTVIAILSAYFSTESTAVLFGSTFPAPEMVRLFSSLTTIVSAITGYFTLLSQRDPRKRWSTYRRLAEELRATYFKFMARLDNFSSANRVDNLRSAVLDIENRGLNV
jgi:hypothetical protein